MTAINLYASRLGSLTGISHPGLPRKYYPDAFITPTNPTSQDMKRASDAFREAFRNIPDEWLVAVSTPLYAFCYLLWDWVDSVINVCCTERRNEFKATSRKIRNLKTNYDRFRSCVVDRKLSEREDHIGGLLKRVATIPCADSHAPSASASRKAECLRKTAPYTSPSFKCSPASMRLMPIPTDSTAILLTVGRHLSPSFPAPSCRMRFRASVPC